MRLKAVILENFRAYKEKTIIRISCLTAIIGKNDAGKSSILEALDIFFEGGTIKIDSADANKSGDPKNVLIGVIFDSIPDQLVLDSNAATTLANEHLLNEDGDLEIYKVFNCTLQSPKAAIFALAKHPTAKDVADLIQKNQKELKSLVKERGLETKCKLTENPSMRYAILQEHNNLELQLRRVPLNDDNGKAVWSSLQNYLPIFALFQSDRPSNDQDPEVQNPMKVAIEKALDQLEKELDQITDQVQRRAQETADRTLVKLQEIYPDLASVLKPKFKKPSWKSVFKIDLEGDDNIPLNKRGSGVRRLILLSFFQAEAEKKRLEVAAGAVQQRRVIYAIEEPETSQHPDSQGLIIRALLDLANAGDQVVLTTHVPGLASLIPLESLRYVDRIPYTREIRVREGTAEVYDEIAKALGVLPEPVQRQGLRVAVLVEGKTDIDALRSMAKVMADANEIPPLDETKIFWTIGGGDQTLMDWIERRYLDKLGIHQVIIQDSDRTAAAIPLNQKKAKWLQDMQALPHVTPFLTRKRSMDNYVHQDAIERATQGAVKLPSNVNSDFDKIADVLSQLLTQARAAKALNGFQPVDHDGKSITETKPTACKRIICAYLLKEMTATEIAQRATYQDGTTTKHEVREWLEAIAANF